MQKITIKWLEEKNACTNDYENGLAECVLGGDIVLITKALMVADRFKDANWLMTNYFTKEQKIKYAIFAAELVIDIFENKYPEDNKPRKAIEAAKEYLKTQNKNAYAAAANAANAAYAAAANAAYAAAYAANAAYAAAAYAAAANAANAAYAAYGNNVTIKRKIINYGLQLVKEGA